MIGKLDKLIAEHGHSANFLEEEMRWPQGRVSKWRSGIGEPTASQVWKIAAYYKVSADYLLDDGMESDPTLMQPWEIQALKVIRKLGEDETLNRLVVTSGPNEFRAADPSKQLGASQSSAHASVKPRRA